MLEVVPVYWPLLALSLCFLAICIVLQRPASRLAQIVRFRATYTSCMI